ncbi:MAG TPA: aminotransferase class I/II-fold pyridoxal phosphate-dependent enzyme [Aquella sp.]|nr:aminotransferase class I/II-fold pyridoxal phosphate-dependent enzyme [Aquella sp.]
MQKSTKLLQLRELINDPAHSTSMPIYQSATFAGNSIDDFGTYDYSRSGNPNRDVVEAMIADLEEAKHAFLFNSGIAAIHVIFELLCAGDHIIVAEDLYGGTHRLLNILPMKNISISYVDATDAANITAAINSKTKMVLIETPSNPLQKIINLPQTSEICKKHNLLLAVDNSLLSPWWQLPLKFGVDIVVHSATKHLSGHSDTTSGVICTNNEEVATKIKFLQNALGVALAPFDCWLLYRGLKTLPLRVKAAQDNTLKLIEYLKTEPVIKQIYYCGMESHPGFAIHKNQSTGFGSVLSIDTENVQLSKKIVDLSQLFTIAVSFGSLSSFISMPVTMSHASVPADKLVVPPSLIRLSIGIEDVNDLIDDLKQAIKTANK